MYLLNLTGDQIATLVVALDSSKLPNSDAVLEAIIAQQPPMFRKLVALSVNAKVLK